MDSFGKYTQHFWGKEWLIPGSQAVTVALVDEVKYVVENQAQLRGVTAKPRRQISVPARKGKPFQQNTQPFQTSACCPLGANKLLREVQSIQLY